MADDRSEEHAEIRPDENEPEGKEPGEGEGPEEEREPRKKRADAPRDVVAGVRSRMARQWAKGWGAAMAAFLAALFLARALLGRRIWYWWDPLYPFLHLANTYLWAIVLLFALFAALVAAVVVRERGWRLVESYLGQVARAAERMVEAPGERIELPADLAQLEMRLNAARDRAQAAEARADLEARRKNDLLVYLAHDLKTPLTSVIGYLQLLHDEPGASPETRARYEAVALEKAQRLEDLVNEFFEVARLELVDAALARSEVNLTRMVEQELSESQPAMEPKGLSYAFKAEPDVTVSCDVGKVERVLGNLVGNAVAYSDPGTVVEVGLRREERGGEPGALLTMTNRGDTIPEAQLGRLFEQFYRLSGSRDSGTGGAGLGLAISRRIVEAHGGTVAASSSEGAVTFQVWLPAKPPARAAL